MNKETAFEVMDQLRDDFYFNVEAVYEDLDAIVGLLEKSRRAYLIQKLEVHAAVISSNLLALKEAARDL